MKPVAIFRHSPTEGPGHFAIYLKNVGIPWTLIRLDEGEAVPRDPAAWSGLCFMGGPMSVNDDLPWISSVLGLIREAVRQDVPVIGHCLGGQLMSRALGGSVGRNPVKEIGWGDLQVNDVPEARQWFGDVAGFESFHWHGETFSIPPGATRIAGNAHCVNQMFVMGRHLGMQCHVEITPEMVRTWCRDWDKERAGEPTERVSGGSMQTPAEMQADMEHRCDVLHGVAEGLYQRWIQGLKT